VEVTFTFDNVIVHYLKSNDKSTLSGGVGTQIMSEMPEQVVCIDKGISAVDLDPKYLNKPAGI